MDIFGARGRGKISPLRLDPGHISPGPLVGKVSGGSRVRVVVEGTEEEVGRLLRHLHLSEPAREPVPAPRPPPRRCEGVARSSGERCKLNCGSRWLSKVQRETILVTGFCHHHQNQW